MSYIDVYVAAVPNANKEAYRAHGEQMAQLFKEHGALEATNCWGVNIPQGEVISFPMAVQCADDETVVTGWTTWPSREARDTAMAQVMPKMRAMMQDSPMPLDRMRLIFGGFEPLHDG